jgi:hypothetical protein
MNRPSEESTPHRSVSDLFFVVCNPLVSSFVTAQYPDPRRGLAGNRDLDREFARRFGDDPIGSCNIGQGLRHCVKLASEVRPRRPKQDSCGFGGALGRPAEEASQFARPVAQDSR